jgi:hypothetical protein
MAGVSMSKNKCLAISTPASRRLEKREVIMNSIEKPVAMARGASNGIGLLEIELPQREVQEEPMNS